MRWRHAPGELRDWIGVYRAGETTSRSTSASSTPRLPSRAKTSFLPGPNGAPLPPGDYELRLMLDESYVVLAKAPFGLLP